MKKQSIIITGNVCNGDLYLTVPLSGVSPTVLVMAKCGGHARHVLKVTQH